MTDKQIMHKANGIARIAQAVKLCDLAPVLTGTIYSKRFNKMPIIDINHFGEWLNKNYVHGKNIAARISL